MIDVGIGAALRALGTPDALAALRMSLVLTLISAVVNAVVGTLGAIALVRQRFFGRSVVNALADLPLAISPVMIGLAFLLLVGRGGWLAAPLEALGIKVLFAFPGLVLGTLFVTLPFTMREVAYVLEEIGTSEEEAAATLGASPVQTFLRVTLPNIRHRARLRHADDGGALARRVRRRARARRQHLAADADRHHLHPRHDRGARDRRRVRHGAGARADVSVGLWLALEWAKQP